MKKIFWTTIIWFVIIFLFRSYLRLFNAQLGARIGSWFGTTQQVCLTGNVAVGMTGLTEEFATIKTQLDLIAQKLESEPQSSVSTSLFQTTVPTKVALYYFNTLADQKLPPEQQVNTNSLLPIYRIFPASPNLLVATIDELLKWNLTAIEKTQWFMTEFPHPKFALLSADLAADWVLTLTFPEVAWFTDGWSARMLMLSSSIEKTVRQFPWVKKVVFVPETLFQP